MEEREVLIPDESRIGGGRKLDFRVADSLRQLRHRGDGDGFQEAALNVSQVVNPGRGCRNITI